MCNNYEQRVSYEAFRDVMRAVELGIAGWNSKADLPLSDSVRINDLAPVMRLAGEDVELAQISLGFPSQTPKDGLVFNFRSESRGFANSNRCLIPASAFFEFTGQKYPKTKHRFTLNGQPFMAIAGLWRAGTGNQPAAFTMLTTAPGRDVEPYHNRQIVVLRPADWSAWLHIDEAGGGVAACHAVWGIGGGDGSEWKRIAACTNLKPSLFLHHLMSEDA